MPGEVAAVAQSNPSIAPKKKSASLGKAALAKITLLDGSILDVTIDRKAKGKDLINSICAGLNIAEKDYFGLLYSNEFDPRVWLDLEKPVSKYLKTDPWIFRFTVKFYPPEPAQLQEDITRYHLCLQVRNDILDGRLPCSFVTHALLGSYLVQSEVGDFDPIEHKDRRYLQEFKFAPNQTAELEEKVHDLHKTHRGQTPAEAELHYLENAKKLAMYGCDFHPAFDSEGVDIMICICASGILIYKEKLRINRFAWAKILKISYKHHNFFIKIRPAEFEQYESTVGFRLATHRACKKLWKSSVEHHTFFRLMTPEIIESTFFPKIGSKFRYSGRTMHQTKKAALERPAPSFERSLTGKRLTSRSMDAIVLEKDKPAKRKFIGSRSPDSVPDDLSSVDQHRDRSPTKKNKKDKDDKGKKSLGGLSILSPLGKSDKRKGGNDSTLSGDNDQDPNETSFDSDRSPSSKRKGFSLPGLIIPKDKTPKDKTPKDKSGKDKGSKQKDGKGKPIAIAIQDPNVDIDRSKQPETPSHESVDDGGSPSRRRYTPGGFRYDEPPHGPNPGILGTGQYKPAQSTKPGTGLSFNYAPGGNDAVREQAEKLKAGELSPKSKGRLGKSGDITAPRTPPPAVPTTGGAKTPTTAGPKTPTTLAPKPPIAVSPKTPDSDKSDPSKALIDNERLGAQTPEPRKLRVKILIIHSKLDPKTRRLDTVNGNVEHTSGLLNLDTGKIETSTGVIDPKKATVEVISGDSSNRGTTHQGLIDPKTGNIHVASLAQVICISPDDGSRLVEVSCITGKLDEDGKIDILNGTFERSRGLLNLKTSCVDTIYGTLNLLTGDVHGTDAKGKPLRRSAIIDPNNGQLTIIGLPDRTGKVDPTIGQLIAIGAPIEDPLVEVTVVAGKLDKKGILDLQNATIENSTGQVNSKTRKIDTKYGQIDLIKHTIIVADPKSGKQESKDVKIDPNGQIVVKNCLNPKTGKVEKDYCQIISLKVVNKHLDPATHKVVSSAEGKDIYIDPKSNKIWIEDLKDSSTNDIIYSSSQVDLKSPSITYQFGLLNPSSKEVDKFTKTDPKLYHIDETGQLFTSTGEKDDISHAPLFAASRLSADNSEVITKVIKVDPKTGKLIIVRITAIPTEKPSPNDDKDDSFSSISSDTSKSKSGPTKSKLVLAPLSVLGSLISSATSSSSPTTPASDKSSQVPSTPKTPTSVTGGTSISAASTPQTPQTPQVPTATTAKPGASVKKALFPELPKSTQAPLQPAPAPPTVPSSQAAQASVTSKSTDPAGVKTTSVQGVKSADKATIPPKVAGVVPPKLGVTGATPLISKITTSPGVSPATSPTSATAPVSIVPQKDVVLEIIALSGKINPKTGKVDVATSNLEKTTGILDVGSGFIKTKYGQINPKTREYKTTDPKTGRSETKAVSVDSLTGQVVITGAVNPKTNKIDNSLGHLISFGSEIDPIVEVTTISGKYDSKKNIIDPKTAVVSNVLGSLDPATGIISTPYGELNLITQKISTKNPKTQKPETKDVKIASTGQIILRNEVNPKTNKSEKDYGRIITLRIVNRLLDPKTGRVDTPLTVTDDIIVDPDSNRIWVPESKDPVTNEIVYSSGEIDPKTGFVIKITGSLNPKTNKIDKHTGIESNVTKVDPSGQVFVATGKFDEATGEPLFATTQVDEESGELYTKVAKIDPETKKIILIKIILLTKKDASGQPQEVDPSTCDIDPATGRIQNIFSKTVYVYNIVDPITKEIIQVDPSDPRVAGARTTVTQTLTLKGEIDPITGRIKTEYGHIDPETGDIDPATAVKDPVTNKLILNYAQIDPTHFGKEVTITKETTPITRDAFFEGIKHLGPAAIRHTDEGEEEDLAQYVDSSKVSFGSGKYNTPKVVKTTTKQVITKNDGGVTHNVEEEIRNLGTGEVVFNTQEHKADPDDAASSGNYVTATAVTTRTATTHEDLGKNAKTQQLEEKTVATTTTHNLNRQEQRVVTQEVKTTATVTSGEQFNRRDSVSSNSSADSGTPIDGPYDESQASSTSPKEPKSATAVSVIEVPQQGDGADDSKVLTASGEEIISTQTVTSKTRTVETITYKTERDGIVETRVEQKITIQSDGDPIDHDTALAEAIQEATAMNPEMTVEKIEIQQQREQ